MFINLNKSDEKEKVKETLNKMKNDNELQFWIGLDFIFRIKAQIYRKSFC